MQPWLNAKYDPRRSTEDGKKSIDQSTSSLTSSKLTKSPGNTFYQYYIKIRLHSIGKIHNANFLILYTSIVKSQIDMVQANLFTDKKHKSPIIVSFTQYMLLVE